MKILIADDDRSSRHLLQRQLEEWGHDVACAANGTEAWDLFTTYQFPVVISDWMMPGLDGLELIRRIRSSEFPGYVYTILLTAKTLKQDFLAGVEAGADDFLMKPVDRDELQARLRTCQRIVDLEHDLAERNQRLNAANQRMIGDLEAAARIQQALLPPSTAAAFPEAHFAWTFDPCDELGGDILNIFRLDEAHLGFYLLDVSGHGVPAALLSVSLSHLLSPGDGAASILTQTMDSGGDSAPTSPRDVADRLNRMFVSEDGAKQFFTFFYCILNTKSLELQYLSAGHPSALLLSDSDAVHLLKSTGPPIGMLEEADYVDQCVTLKPGDRLYLYSDGVIEAMHSERREQFGLERLTDAIRDAHTQPLDSTLSSVLDSVREWCGIAGPADDISCLAMEMAPAGLATTPKLRHNIRVR